MIEIPLAPLSVNRAYTGRRFKTPEHKQFTEDCLLLLTKCKEKYTGWVDVEYHFYVKNYKKADVGNMEKTITDILVHAGILEDDRFIKSLYLEKHESKEERMEITIRGM